MYILKRIGESTEPWGILLRCNLQRLFLPFSSTIKWRFDSIVLTNFVSFTSSVRSNSFCSRLLWFTVSYTVIRSINATPVIILSSKPSSICRVRLSTCVWHDFPGRNLACWSISFCSVVGSVSVSIIRSSSLYAVHRRAIGR